MGKRVKSITINHCYQFKTGTHDIILPDKVDARLKIKGSQKNPTCRLTFRTENAYGQRVDHTWIDKGCDGRRIDKKTKTTGKKTKEPPKTDYRYMMGYGRPYKGMGFNRFGDAVMQKAMRQIVRNFSYRPCVKPPEPPPQMPVPRMSRLPMGMSGLGSKGGLQVRYTKRPKQYPEIHFDTAKSAIRPEGRKTLDDFVAGHLRGAILIEGHCDHRGDDQYNFELGKRRAKATKQYLVKAFKSAGKNVPEMVVMSLGETKSTGVSLDADRRALIISGAKGQWAAKRIVTKRALDFSKTGVYLIDASGSMADVWDIVKSHKFPKGSMLYSFNECRRVREGMPERTGCGTPLWDSLQTVLLQMNEKGSLTLISDGADTGRSGRSRLGRRKRRHDELEQTQDLNEAVKLATDKNITINVVYVGEPDEIHSIHMRDLAKGTGGKFYIRTD